MSLVIALVIAVMMLVGIIYALMALLAYEPEPDRGDGVWRVQTDEVANGRLVAVYVSRGAFQHKIDAVDKDALDFTDQLRELRATAQIKADQWNEAETDVKVLSTEVK